MERAKTLFVLLAAAFVFLPLAAWGQATTATTTACDADTKLPVKGSSVSCGCVNLCDELIATDTTCDEYDFNAVDYSGTPRVLIFEREENNANCTDAGGPVFTITTGPTTGGTPAYEIRTTPIILNDTIGRVVLFLDELPVDAYLFTGVSDATGCDDVDLRMYSLCDGQ